MRPDEFSPVRFAAKDTFFKFTITQRVKFVRRNRLRHYSRVFREITDDKARIDHIAAIYWNHCRPGGRICC